jgi:hypothetical protein
MSHWRYELLLQKLQLLQQRTSIPSLSENRWLPANVLVRSSTTGSRNNMLETECL